MNNNIIPSTTTTIVEFDSYLRPYEGVILQRREQFLQKLENITKNYGSLDSFASWHKNMGFNREGETISYREWAPGAKQLYLMGDFNNWNRTSHPLTKQENGIWEFVCQAADIAHNSQIKVVVESVIGIHDRLPTFIQYTKQNPIDHSYNGVVWLPDKSFTWTDEHYKVNDEPLLIYESHVGMATEEHKVGSFNEFAEKILPYVLEAGYNCIQFMAIMEHPYYGSFGYHVSNLFAVSSRFGTPDEFKCLVDKAHSLGIRVIMDIIHSHAVKNFDEGIDQFDGTDHQFFHGGAKGYHVLWDSKLYNYSKYEVQRYLLSNLKYWLEEYHIDGFRFDGITSMLYHHHGYYKDFVHYDMYFSDEVDADALLYLQLANELIHNIKPYAITIAEDMSGMPGLCRSTAEGGIGFDYRLAMGVPDNWIKTLKEQRDEDWNLSSIHHMLVDRRYGEKTIAYCESHDQALVGDKTIAFRLIDQEMYWNMNKDSKSLIVDRGIALHKLIRFITLTLGGEGYLAFMGNEFGHPEWIDFPREGNQFSYHYARRQWSLRDNDTLRYQYLSNFDKRMLQLVKEYNFINDIAPNLTSIDEQNKILVFERSELIFIFSFNPHNSIPDYEFGVMRAGAYRVILCSDDEEFGGFGRIAKEMTYQSTTSAMHGQVQSLKMYITNRTAIVLRRVSKEVGH